MNQHVTSVLLSQKVQQAIIGNSCKQHEACNFCVSFDQRIAAYEKSAISYVMGILQKP